MNKLTSVKLQSMIDLQMPEIELSCPMLRFGRKDSNNYKFPIVFCEETKAVELCDELKLLIGKTLEESKSKLQSLYEKYKQYHYKKRSSTQNLITPNG